MKTSLQVAIYIQLYQFDVICSMYCDYNCPVINCTKF